MPRLMNYVPAAVAAALLAWFTFREIRRIVLSRTDVSRMQGEITAEQSSLTDEEQELWKQIEAGLTGRLPAGERWFPWHGGSGEGRP